MNKFAITAFCVALSTSANAESISIEMQSECIALAQDIRSEYQLLNHFRSQIEEAEDESEARKLLSDFQHAAAKELSKALSQRRSLSCRTRFI